MFSFALISGIGSALGLSAMDMRRAKLSRPVLGSSVLGDTSSDAFGRMNRVLQKATQWSRPCDSFNLDELNDIARLLYNHRSNELDSLYRTKGDKRALHFSSLEYKERLWRGEEVAAYYHHSISYNATRDGKCAELVMWFIHHLSETNRRHLSNSQHFSLPLMPMRVAELQTAPHEYALQITCTDCHVRVHDPSAPEVVTPQPRPKGSGPQYKAECDETDVQQVYYDRVKRCDWDYEPFCSPCEGIGGPLWGNGEQEWQAIPCEPLMQPEEIPEANLTKPLLPLRFTVSEYSMYTFPGLDPCNPHFRYNSTYDLAQETTPEGPVYHTISTSGWTGPKPLPGRTWAYPNGNFYSTLDMAYANEKHPNGRTALACVCLGLKDPTVTGAMMGGLPYDFLHGARLVGRERIVPEHLETSFVVDHWVKGPHHFWFDVATNLMVREWQPFNIRNVYYNWQIETPSPESMQLAAACTNLFGVNISCPAHHPAGSDVPAWEACVDGVDGHCCHPNGVVGESCPSGDVCQPCGGADSCQCPGLPKVLI